jgi:hypothetical protein
MTKQSAHRTREEKLPEKPPCVVDFGSSGSCVLFGLLSWPGSGGLVHVYGLERAGAGDRPTQKKLCDLLGRASFLRLTAGGSTMFTTIRKYKVQHGSGKELAQRVQDSLVPLLRQLPGFRGHHICSMAAQMCSSASECLITWTKRLPPTRSRQTE